MPETTWLPAGEPTVMDADDQADDSWDCRLCGAPGGFPYCNDACRNADQDDDPDSMGDSWDFAHGDRDPQPDTDQPA